MAKNKREKRKFTILVELDTVTTNEFMVTVVTNFIDNLVKALGTSFSTKPQTKITAHWKVEEME